MSATKQFNHTQRFGSGHECTAQEERAAVKAGIISYDTGVYSGGYSTHTGKPIFAKGKVHGYLVGGSGSHKTTSFYLPNLMMGNLKTAFVHDMKGEIAGCVAPLLYKQGLPCYCFNPYGMFSDMWPYQHSIKQDCYNSIAMPNPESPYFQADMRSFAEAGILMETGTGAHFSGKARGWFSDFNTFLKTSLPDANLVDFRDLIDMMISDFDSFAMLVERAFPKCPFPSVAVTGKEIVAMRSHSPKEYTGVVSTLTNNLTWLNDKAIRSSIRKNDFDPVSLAKKGGYVFYMMPPEHAEKNASLTRLFFASFMIAKQRNPQGEPFHYFLDEMGMMGKYFEEVERGYMLGRSMGNFLYGSVQHTAQSEAYRGGANGFMSSAGLRVFTGVRSLADAEMVSKMAGQSTFAFDPIKAQEQAALKAKEARAKLFNGTYDILTDGLRLQHQINNAHRQERVSRPVITIDEVMTIGTGKAIVFIEDLPVMVLNKRPYWTIPQLAGHYLNNPYRPPYDVVMAQQRFFKKRYKVKVKSCPEHLAHFPQHQSGYYVELV